MGLWLPERDSWVGQPNVLSPRLNLDHPLMKFIEGLYVCNTLRPRNLSPRGDGGAPDWTVASGGPELVTYMVGGSIVGTNEQRMQMLQATSAGRYIYRNRAVGVPSGAGMFVFAVFLNAGSSGASENLGIGDSSASGGAFALRIVNITTLSGYMRCRAGASLGTYGSTPIPGRGSQINAAVYLRSTVDSDGCEVYANGVMSTGNATAQAGTPLDMETECVNGLYRGTNSLGSGDSAVALFGYGKAPAETVLQAVFLEWTKRPWQLFE